MARSAINKAAKTYAGLDVSLKETAILHAIWRNGTEFEWQTADMELA